MENQKPNKLIYFIPVVIAIIALIFVVSGKKTNKLPSPSSPETGRQLQNPSTEQGSQPTIAVVDEKGVFSLATKDGKNTYRVGEVITIVVIADSNNKSITGYDVVLPYEASTLTYKGNTNLDARYQVFGSGKNGNVYITGVKKLSISEPVVFAKIPLVEINFMAQKVGTVVLTPKAAPQSKTDSNLIDDQNEEVLGKTVPLTIEIQ